MKKTKSLQYHQALQFALVAALPVLIIIILVWLFLLPAMRSDTRIRHQGMGRSIAGQVSSHVLGGQRQLAALAHFLETRDGLSARQLTALLDSQCGEGELFETIYIFSPRKQIVMAVGLARSRRSIRQDLLGLDLSGRTFLTAAGRPKEPVWSETFLSTVSRRLAVALTIPLSDNLITAEITLDNLSSVISQLPVESGFLTYVIDRKGRIVADSRRLNWGQRLNVAISSLTGPEEGGPFISGSFELDGKSFLGTVVAIDELGWKVMVAQPAANAYKSLRTALTMFGLGLAIALMLALSLSLNRARQLSKVFQTYGEKAGAIANGRYDDTWPSSTITELNRMGQSLKHMAAMIDQREKELVENREELRNLIANAPGIVYEFSGDPEHPEFNDVSSLLKEKTLEVLGINWQPEHFFNDFTDCLPKEDQSRFVLSVQEAVDNVSSWHYEGRFIKPGGDEIWIECSSEPRRVGGKIIFYGLITDSTRRKEMESSLWMARFIIDNANIAIQRIARDGRIAEVNLKAAELLGYTKEELESLFIWDIDTLATPDSWKTDHWETLVGVSRKRLEREHLRKDGSVIQVSIFSNILEYEGRLFAVDFVQDISERKRIEKSLRQNEELLSNILESMDEALAVFDESLTYRLVNKKHETLTNKTRQEVIGKHLLEAFPHFRESLTEKMIHKAMQGDKFSSIEAPHTLDGRSYLIRESHYPLKEPDGRVIGVVSVVSDITQQKQDQEELRRLRNYLSNIIDSMPSVLVAVDLDGRVTLWNRHTENITGLSIDQARSQPLGDVFPRLAGEMELIRTAIRQRRVISSPKVPRRTDSEIRFEAITIFPLTTNGVEGAVIRVDDVTEQVRLEEMMIQSEKMLSVGGLAAGMAHEINNPLAGMMQTAGVMAGRLGANLDIPANQRAAREAGTTVASVARFMELRGIPRMLESINESGRRVAEIVENMLGFARKSEAALSTHDLGKLLDKTLELAVTDYDLKKKYDFKRITINKDYGDPPVSVCCEGTKIQQVLLNILRNGAEAMRDTASPRFILRTRQEGDTAAMEIEDNGPGMDEQTCKRIFEPFFTTKPVGVGTGLGLSVSYFIITENHGGEMTVASSPGKGAKFIIRLPNKGSREYRMRLR